jgi:membrane protease YdiL (CAAX protease family)
MANRLNNYWEGARHPWSCVLFVLPLVAIYEAGVVWLGAPATDGCRNGADVWLRDALRAVGVGPECGAPGVLLLVLLIWALWRRRDRPADQMGVWAGMTAESAVHALSLLLLSQGLWQLLQTADRVLCSHGPRPVGLFWSGPMGAAPEPVVERIIAFLGAGIYEETLFRLLLFSGLLALFTLADFSAGWSFALAGIASALGFAAAHHLGPNGEPFSAVHFSFRTIAGLYFATLYRLRGFGVAVGTHALYDVLVGLLVCTF